MINRSSFRVGMSDKKSGSALIFVLIIIAGIVTVTIGGQRLSLVQFNQATRQEDNTFAYYGARSGIEDGLLRFRHQRNVQTGEEGEEKVHRFDVTSGISAGEVTESAITENNPDGFIYDPSHQYYDLSIDYKTDQIGDFNFSIDPPKLAKDEEIQLTGFQKEYDAPYYLRYGFKFIKPQVGDCDNAFVQIQQITEIGGGPIYDQAYDQVQVPYNGGEFFSDIHGQNMLVRTSNSLSSYFRIRPYYCDVQYAFSTATGSNNQIPGPKFDSLITKITATGYFGKAKRTLQAQVDRKSGTLINIYDFNLYSGQGNIKPRQDR